MAKEIIVAREGGVASLRNAVSSRTMAFANPNRRLSGEAKTRDAIYNRGYSLIYSARERGEFEKEARIWNAMDNMFSKNQSVNETTRRRKNQRTYNPKAEKPRWTDEGIARRFTNRKK